MFDANSEREITGVLGFPEDWQEPAATEKYAYESVVGHRIRDEFIYFAFPWATLIDSLEMWSSALANKLLVQLRGLEIRRSYRNQRVVTVCQHIRLEKYIEIFKKVGVTDIFWSHKLIGGDEINGIRIHAFPLFPVQTFSIDKKEIVGIAPSNRKYLANFIGAYNPNIYLTDVRQHIINDKGKFDDILIIDRNGWHFDRHVYEEQMVGVSPSHEKKSIEELKKQEYLNAIVNSKFTLCPTGSGPNSIRIFECIELLSIPVILTLDLDLPGSRDLWRKACLFAEDSRLGYQNALEVMNNMGDEELEEKRYWLGELGKHVLPGAYFALIVGALGNGSR